MSAIVFPFWPQGLVAATAVLGSALVVFGLALRALDVVVTRSSSAVLGALVRGLREWERPGSLETGLPSSSSEKLAPLAPAERSSGVAAPPMTRIPGGALLEESAAPAAQLEHVRRRRR